MPHNKSPRTDEAQAEAESMMQSIIDKPDVIRALHELLMGHIEMEEGSGLEIEKEEGSEMMSEEGMPEGM